LLPTIAPRAAESAVSYPRMVAGSVRGV
jgi:hypothetical protein